jgi:hypothetical protein
MIDPPKLLLVANLALSFYLVGAIWAHEVDIFRSWQFIDAKDFHAVHAAHWRKLPYWIFTPLGLALTGSVGLIWYHPAGSPGFCNSCEFRSSRFIFFAHGHILGQVASET